MRALLVTERRYYETPDGAVWTPTTLPYAFWQRYLTVFDEVRVLARVRKVPNAFNGWHPVEGERVSVAPLPDFEGPFEYLRKHFRVCAAIRQVPAPCDAVILRVPSHISMLVSARLSRVGHPFALEVIGDPFEVFSPGTMTHPLRRFFQHRFTRGLVRQCQQACAVSYVTAEALQRRYPAREGAFSLHFSDVELPPEAFAPAPRVFTRGNKVPKLITVGTLAQMYKAPDVLIDAVALCAGQGVDSNLAIVGDGKFRPRLEDHVGRLGMKERIAFLGQIPSGEPVRGQLDSSDLFVLPSRTEGLPRALLEAMARGLPCIASEVGGIGELLPPEDLVPPGDCAALAKKIADVLASPARMNQMAQRNLERARHYRSEVLSERRKAFYAEVRRLTEEFNSGRHSIAGEGL